MEIPKGSTLYFDTNIFEGVNDNKCNKLQELAATKNVKCCCPPRVLIELCSQLFSHKDEFNLYRAPFRKQKGICSNRILPYFQHVLAEYFGLGKPPLENFIPLEDFIKIRDLITDSKGYDECREKMPLAQDTSGKQIPLDKFLPVWREDYEKIWVETVYSLANEEILEPKKAFLNMMIQTAGGKCANELSPSRVDELLKPIEAHFSVLTKVLEDNRKPKQKYSPDTLKNYYNDLELLLYLGPKDHFFITNDKTLRNKVDDSCEQKKRILTFDEAVCELQR